MTKQEVSEGIVGCAEKLKHVPSFSEVVKMTEISRRQVRRHFGSYTRALEECNLERKETGGGGQKLPLEKLFVDWAGVVQRLGKAPSMGEYEMLSKYTTGPLVRRFGSWRQVPHGLRQFAESRGLAEEWKAELELVRGGGAAMGEIAGTGTEPAPVHPHWPPMLLNRPAYGPPLWPGPMAYGPVNELGVVFLFGALAWQMGFVVHRLQAEFPDCEAMRRVGEEKSQLVKIEFEHESRNFLKHMHDASKCDLIICWKHNWPECPLEVIELRKEIAKIAGIAKIAEI
jgi:hypothetical protein